ncbi:transglycosylase domain-containing protein [Leptospira borgpetersenii]|uniref:transglycosylase domain-containing protein n=1 Tax=Leptospira borgpetersenii TaxID=174 RepID=UPI0007730D03|nr:transglycosylase domain-containing protein [Leptospira borgpetersenii]MBE8401710.1 transglycosylase domain-containing protein [Leptospira borgpetersenii serovar Tarassovi]MBE8404002.1 transglycosylase domain-containing protein [Leptospira borgpetersenii serovar Tarassovi]MBE8404973.1 transglycosylase domain-containing protein [Leptospira borgpetersenii serovar Tarassovi]MBE8413364.1 transglycosylase domain-containing protein [Leptospira borgpetersenii serovar Tarassovi]MBE8417348.1 transgly
METGIQTLRSSRFLCPECETTSRLPEGVPTGSIFRLTCYQCGHKALVKMEVPTHIKSIFPSDEILPHPEQPKDVGTPHFQAPSHTGFESTGLGIPEKIWGFVSQFQIHLNEKIRKLIQKFRNIPKGQKSDPFSSTTDNPFLQRKKISFEKKPFFIVRREIEDNGQPRIKTLAERLREQIGDRRFQLPNVVLLSAGVIISLLLVGMILFWVGVITRESELKEMISLFYNHQPSVIYDRDGKKVSEIFAKKTSNLEWDAYPENLKKIVLLVEDRKFFSHSGINYMSVLRAAFVNIASFRFKQGASTITQQLARILLDDREKSLVRKIKEAQLAFALEYTYEKKQILLYYLNNVYLGHGAFGFASAAEFYFRKTPSELDTEEMIVLASLASAPNRFSPLKNPDLSRQRVNAIVHSFQKQEILKENPKPKLDEIYLAFHMRSPGETVFGNRKDDSPYVTEHVRKFLNSLYPDSNIYETGGFSIHTTIAEPVQAELSKIVKNYLDNIQKSGLVRKTKLTDNKNSSETAVFRKYVQDISPALELFIDTDSFGGKSESGLQVALVAVDPATGEILLMHGGSEFKADNQLDRTTAMKRQTGSSIKPILYSAAIETELISASSRILDAPLIYRNQTGNWMPENIGNQYDGDISVRHALAKSKNTAAVQIAEKLGISKIQDFFQKYFFPDPKVLQSRFRGDLSLALGSLEISPLEMALAYSAFANDGTIKRPYLIQKITDRSGKIVYERKSTDEFGLKVPEERKVLSSQVAEIMIDLLHGSANSAGVRSTGYRGEVAGKTGTTNDNRDNWFVGVKPGMSMAIWLGYDDPSYGLGSSALGGTVAAPLWGSVAKTFEATEDEKRKYPVTEHAISITVCEESGKLPGPSCKHPRKELFKNGTVPSEICPLNHGTDVKREVLRNVF